MSTICNVKATTLGYAPNEAASYIFTIGFGLCGIVTTFLGVKRRTWAFSTPIAAGSFLECAGYAARIAMHFNPCNSDAFRLQIVAIILGATIICVGLYLTLKDFINALDPSLSRMRPRWYPIIFVPADVSCLVVQAIGGALAASAGGGRSSGNTIRPPNMSLMNAGNNTIVVGICLQVVVLICFGLVAGDFVLRARKSAQSPESIVRPDAIWTQRRFKTFIFAITGAYTAILIRCIYRIAEMAGGWGNEIMQDEPTFSVFESLMILIACILLSVFPPSGILPLISTPQDGNMSSSNLAMRVEGTNQTIGMGSVNPSTSESWNGIGKNDQNGQAASH
ncbi:hypothetical protein KVR01_000063 [Diaporthe batatas]|uniref:uncharacterized protein n=1 Tax=Diaporthe batatas TaxID=748121 RepID=UPI001D044DA1|nr:uncharacterized protein KVR01_000063 [Diaporthe batatas]KAG8169318.1 hypothetical protein KVR01_000063 [Diaporthe batatas]